MRPDTILEAAGKILDFDRPIALSLLALLHFVDDEDGAAELVDRLVERLPSGSYLLLSHTTGDFDPEGAAQARDMYKARGMTLRLRSRTELTAFFHGLELIEPGVALSAEWRPELGEVVRRHTRRRADPRLRGRGAQALTAADQAPAGSRRSTSFST